MDLALELARGAGRRGEVPVGAVVVIDGQIVGKGANQAVSAHDPTSHAEINAIRDAAAGVGNYRLDGSTLYVTLEPCPMCAGAMVHARIQRLVYGCPDPKAGGVESLYRISADARLNHQVETHAGVRASECRQLLQSFFRSRRK